MKHIDPEEHHKVQLDEAREYCAGLFAEPWDAPECVYVLTDLVSRLSDRVEEFETGLVEIETHAVEVQRIANKIWGHR